VQITAHAAAFFLSRANQVLARALQIFRHSLQMGGQAHGVDGHTCLAGKIIQQPAVGGREALAGGTRSQEQLTDCFVLIYQGQPQGFIYWRT
jgi:hypothetical protein